MKFFAKVLSAIFAVAFCVPPATAQTNSAAKNGDLKVVEAWGWVLAWDEKVAGIEINSNELSLFLKGFLAGTGNRSLPYNSTIFSGVDQLAKARREKVTRGIIQENLTRANAFVAALKQNTNVAALPENVFYEPIKSGEGPSPRPAQSVTVHYTARLLDGTEFYQAGPVDMVLVTNRSVCRGWIPTVEKLRKGDVAKLYVPPPLPEEQAESWGIEPGAMMVFEIELLDVKETSPEDLANAMIPTPPDSAPEKSSYSTEQVIEAWGWRTARRARLNQFNLGENEISSLAKGLAAAVKAERAPEDLEKNESAVDAFVAARREQMQSAARQKQSAEMERLFADLKRNTNVVELSDGLRYEILRQGDKTFPKDGQTVLVNYVGHLIDGSVFDKTMGDPLRVKVGSVIRGWNEGIQKVSKGGKINLYIPPSLAYGDESVSGIPAGSALIYEIELVEIDAQ